MLKIRSLVLTLIIVALFAAQPVALGARAHAEGGSQAALTADSTKEPPGKNKDPDPQVTDTPVPSPPEPTNTPVPPPPEPTDTPVPPPPGVVETLALPPPEPPWWPPPPGLCSCGTVGTSGSY